MTAGAQELPIGVIDAQLHTFDAYPPDVLLSMMDAAGIHAAVLVHMNSTGWDMQDFLDVVSKHADRFAAVGSVDPAAPDAAERIAAFRATPNALGVRVVVLTTDDRKRLEAGYYDPIFVAAQRQQVPVFLCADYLFRDIAEVARRFPDTLFVVDHLGLYRPQVKAADIDPWRGLPDLVSLAKGSNIAVKLTGVPSLSVELYPFDDVWPHLHEVIAAFGPDRLMWGTDFTHTSNLYTYGEAVGYMLHSHLSVDEKQMLMGGTLRTLLHWPTTVGAIHGHPSPRAIPR